VFESLFPKDNGTHQGKLAKYDQHGHTNDEWNDPQVFIGGPHSVIDIDCDV